MKQSVLMLTGACALTVILAGCSPQLDQTQLSPEEQVWAKNFKANYSAWQPPESIPRSVRRDDLPANQTPGAGSSETVPTDQLPPAEQQPGQVDQVPTLPVPPAPEKEEVKPLPEAPADVPPAAEDAADEPVVYTVVKGDSLGLIAVKHYGKYSAWKKIQKANMNVLRGKNKDVVIPGMKLQIPKK